MPHSKLNILIVMPRFVKNVGEGYYFPLGIAYISSSLKEVFKQPDLLARTR